MPRATPPTIRPAVTAPLIPRRGKSSRDHSHLKRRAGPSPPPTSLHRRPGEAELVARRQQTRRGHIGHEVHTSRNAFGTSSRAIKIRCRIRKGRGLGGERDQKWHPKRGTDIHRGRRRRERERTHRRRERVPGTYVVPSSRRLG